MSDDARTWTDEDARMVAEALRCAETGNATHWPTVAGWLAAEVARLRAQVAKLESTGDRVADALHGEVGDYYFLVEQWRTMRAELDRHRVAGDAMADDILHVDPDDPNANEWRSVRGDAPTAGGLLPDKRILIDLTPPSRAIPADQRRKLAAELRSRFVDGPVDEWSAGWLSAAGYIGSDSPIGTDAGTDLAAPAVAPTEPPAAAGPGGTNVVRSGVGRGFPRVHGRCPTCRAASLFLAVGDHVTCASLSCPNPTAAADYLDRTVEDIAAAQDSATEPLAVGLPVTLSSPDDVAAVCLAHGLTVRSSGPGWTQWRDPDTKAVVHCEAWQSGVERVTVAGRDRADIYRPVARGTLVAAIEAAWGETR